MSDYKAPWWPSPSCQWSECSIFESSPNTQKVGSSKMSRMNTRNFFLNVCKPKFLVSPAQWFWWLRIQFPQWNLNNNISARQHRFVGCQLRNKRRTQHYSLTLDSIIIIIIIIIVIPTFDSVDTIDEGLHVVVALFLACQEIQLCFKSGQQL